VSGKISRKSLLLSFLVIAVVLVPLFVASPEAYAQPCQVFQFDSDFPPTVAPGQTFQVASTVSLACYQWRTYYGGRVDIVDPASNTVLSISTFEIGTMPSVTATVSNSATAPQTQGPWDLQLILYIFESGGIVESIKRPINIHVGPQSVSTTQQMASTVSTTLSETSTTTQTSYATETTVSTLTPGMVVSISTNTITTTDNSMSASYGILVVVLLVLLGATVFLFLTRPTRNQPRDH
jgi:hypothetical protein